MNKIDFALVISAQFCNPNGDPLNGNRPRQDIDGYGYITDVCLKHKIRNRLSDFGEHVLILDNDHVTDGNYSIRERVDAEETLKEHLRKKDIDAFKKEACCLWIDVRSFGQVFPFKDISTNSVSLGVRGPVTIQMAKSLNCIDIVDYEITKSTNTEKMKDRDKDSTTMGMKYVIQKGAYVAYGSIFPQLAEMTGFSYDDALLLKKALSTIFENDASSARPSGSMGSQLFWWEHNSICGAKNSLYVHKSLHISPKEDFPFYSCEPEKISGITLFVL